MVKSPMDYFQEQDFSMDAPSDQGISQSEKAFLKKYLGIDDPSALQGMAPVDGVPVAGMALSAVRAAAAAADRLAPRPEPVVEANLPAVPADEITQPVGNGEESGSEEHAAEQALTATENVGARSDGQAGSAPGGRVTNVPVAAQESTPSVDALLPTLEIVTLVGFYVSGDVFVVPIDSVMEVIRYEEPFKLPMSPAFMPGVVNLRGRILPVIRLSDLLILEGSRPKAETSVKNSLIIICEAKGLQVGLLIDKLHTMFKAKQDQINWNAEVHLGPSAELLSGLLETGEKLLGIVSVERLVDKLLEI